MHKLTVIKLSGCSLSHVALSGRRPDKQMASPRRSAFWASWVIASASSRITNLKPFLEEDNIAVEGWGVLLLMWVTRCLGPAYLKMVLVLAKLKIGPRTTSIPRSSDAFNCICETPNLVCDGGEKRPHKLLPKNWAHL